VATVKIAENPYRVRKIESSKFYTTKIREPRGIVKVNETLPFRISLTNIIIPGYGPNNVPGIGLQVIGFSNFIL
jgi:hypothetical protein